VRAVLDPNKVILLSWVKFTSASVPDASEVRPVAVAKKSIYHSTLRSFSFNRVVEVSPSVLRRLCNVAERPLPILSTVQWGGKRASLDQVPCASEDAGPPGSDPGSE